jgi:hypothetical protein
VAEARKLDLPADVSLEIYPGEDGLLQFKIDVIGKSDGCSVQSRGRTTPFGPRCSERDTVRCTSVSFCWPKSSPMSDAAETYGGNRRDTAVQVHRRELDGVVWHRTDLGC